MLDHAEVAANDAEAARIERRRAADRRRKARRRKDPAVRAAESAYLAEYRARYRDALNADRRRYYQANREAELARQRRYDAEVRAPRRAALYEETA